MRAVVGELYHFPGGFSVRLVATPTSESSSFTTLRTRWRKGIVLTLPDDCWLGSFKHQFDFLRNVATCTQRFNLENNLMSCLRLFNRRWACTIGGGSTDASARAANSVAPTVRTARCASKPGRAIRAASSAQMSIPSACVRWIHCRVLT